jgi:hypothetical protein
VDVVAHQTVPRNADGVPGAVAAQQAQVELAVGIFEEDCLLVVAALCDVMPTARNHNPRQSCHLPELVGPRGPFSHGNFEVV